MPRLDASWFYPVVSQVTLYVRECFTDLVLSQPFTSISCLSRGQQGCGPVESSLHGQEELCGFVCEESKGSLAPCQARGRCYQYLLNEGNEHPPRSCVTVLSLDWLIDCVCYRIVMKLLACAL